MRSASPVAQWGRTHLPIRRPRFNPWVGKIAWRRACQPTPVFSPGESLGQRSLVGYSPWGRIVRHNQSNLAHTHYKIKVFFYPPIAKSFYHKWVLKIIECFFSYLWRTSLDLFSPLIWHVVNFINSYPNVKPLYHHTGIPEINLSHYPFYFLLFSC